LRKIEPRLNQAILHTIYLPNIKIALI